MEQTGEQAPTGLRSFDRQDIVNAVVHARGIENGAEVNENGLDWHIANGLNELGYRVLPPNEDISETINPVE